MRSVRIPGAGPSELMLLGAKSGTVLVIGRSWAHAAAFAHVIGQAVGELAHLLVANPAELEFAPESASSPSALRTRIGTDAKNGDVGIVFAVGYAEGEGDAPIRARLVPVVELLARWANLDKARFKRGVELWSVKLAGESAKVETGGLEAATSTASAAASSSAGASQKRKKG